MKKSILVIDDDLLALKMIAAVLEAEGYAAVTSSSAEDAFQKIH